VNILYPNVILKNFGLPKQYLEISGLDANDAPVSMSFWKVSADYVTDYLKLTTGDTDGGGTEKVVQMPEAASVMVFNALVKYVQTKVNDVWVDDESTRKLETKLGCTTMMARRTQQKHAAPCLTPSCCHLCCRC